MPGKPSRMPRLAEISVLKAHPLPVALAGVSAALILRALSPSGMARPTSDVCWQPRAHASRAGVPGGRGRIDLGPPTDVPFSTVLETAREGQNQENQQDQPRQPPADAWSTGVEASASQHYQKNDQDQKHAHGVTFREMDCTHESRSPVPDNDEKITGGSIVAGR
jgi:hypothetical protein